VANIIYVMNKEYPIFTKTLEREKVVFNLV